jgi:hypothetical protein
MKAVLNIAFTFFRFLPLQRALSVICAVLLALAVLSAALSQPDLAMLPAFLGVATLVLAPVMGGGVALRYCLSLPALALRPHGRGRVMLGATLAITLIAVLVTLPVVVARLAAAQPLSLFPATLFAMIWTGTALIWIVVFVISNSRQGLALMMLLPFLFAKFSASLVPLLLHAPWLLSAGLAAWVAFALWYLRPHPIRRVTWLGGAPAQANEQSETFLADPLETRFREMATRQYLLGKPSLSHHAFTGLAALVFVALLMLWMNWVTHGRQNANAARWPLVFLCQFTLFGMSMGYSIVRRARLLWLRAGLDRSGLFVLAERTGLTASYLSIGVAASGLALWMWARSPETGPGLLVAVPAILVLAASLFYLGMALTRGWNVLDVLLGAGLLGLLIAHFVLLRPWAPTAGPRMPWLIGISVMLIPVLRLHALYRWRSLDWRIATIPPMQKRAA